jgi:hypothetical protein
MGYQKMIGEKIFKNELHIFENSREEMCFGDKIRILDFGINEDIYRLKF